MDLHLNLRALDEKRCSEYLNTIEDSMAKEFATIFLSKVRYVGHDEFISSLKKSFHIFEEHIKNTPYLALVIDFKFGSDWWCTLMMQKKNFDIVTKLNGTTDPQNIIVVDDCSYSGNNIFGLLDESLHAIKNVPNLNYIFHIICPYISAAAKENIDGINHIYPLVKILYYPHNAEFIQSALTPVLYPNFFEPEKNSGELFIRPNILKALNMKHGEISALIPIYFDHKIASNTSTAGSVLDHVVYPLPTRVLIEECERNYLHENKLHEK